MIIYHNFIIIHEIYLDNKIRVSSKFPLIFEIKNSNNEYYYIESDFFGLFVFSEFFEDIPKDFLETFIYLWKEYIENTSEPLLSQGASLIRQRFEKFFKPSISEILLN